MLFMPLATPPEAPASRDRQGLSEGQRIAAECGIDNPSGAAFKSRRLQRRWPELMAAVTTLGPVACSGGSPAGRVEWAGTLASDGGSLQARFEIWSHGFAVEERLDDGHARHSLQFFDAQGQRLLDLRLLLASSRPAFFDIVTRFADPSLAPGMGLQRPTDAWPRRPDDAQRLREAWAGARQADAALDLVTASGLAPAEAWQAIGRAFAAPVPVDSAQELLLRAAQSGVSLTLSAGHPAACLRRTGPVRQVRSEGAQVHLREAGYALTLRERRLAQAWLVRAPDACGLVHLLKLFDHDGLAVATIQGERRSGRPERCDWRELAATLGAFDDGRGSACAH